MGAGPAGLTAALELLRTTDVQPIVLEKSTYMGGISRTLNYKGNRMDIGGHRFFSKSDRVMNWWLDILPLEWDASGTEQLAYHGQRTTLSGNRNTSPAKDPDRVMLVRQRKSRIFYLGQFFDYPISLNGDTLKKLGPYRVAKIGLSYLKSALLPIRGVTNLEQFFMNRFGKELYLTFFKEYTEKVWGIECSAISSEWGQQRIKGLSVTKALSHFLTCKLRKNDKDVRQKQTETSLIEKFLYPKFGPGQMWEEVARQVRQRGGTILSNREAIQLETEGNTVRRVIAKNTETGQTETFDADYVISTVPVKELVSSLNAPVPEEVRKISEGLLYRDFITVGLLLKKLKVTDPSSQSGALISDNWIYIQEPGVKAGRLQIFNNWSPYLVKDESTVWIGVEYFCYESDELWKLSDEKLAELAARELADIGIIAREDLLDCYVYRMPKTYPAYFGTYSRFDELRQYLDSYENLFLVGRNGMHKYNNQDHSMLTAMLAVENIALGIKDKSNLWAVNTEMTYQESKEGSEPAPVTQAALSATS